MKRWLSFIAAAALVTGSAAQTTDYPSRPVTIINPWTAGSAPDVIARAVAQSFHKQSGVPFVIENVPGAGSMIGTARAANAKPDGYTLLWGTSTGLVILPQVSPNVKYHPTESFEPISWIGASPYFIVGSATSPYKTLAELVAHAKANPMKVSYASPAPGSAHHVTAEALLSATQARMLHVPFKTSQASISGLIRGDVDWMLDLASTVVPLAQAGKVRLLAITGATRTHTAPDVPTAAEALGLPGFESLSWFGLFAPKGIAADQVKVLNRMAANALQDPEVTKVLSTGGFTASHSTPAQLADRVKREYENWGKVIRSSNIRMD